MHLVQLHRDNSYSKGVISLNNRVIDLLILFLEMNGYRYNPEISKIWFEAMIPWFGTQADSVHRVLCMAADYHRDFNAHLEVIYRKKKSAFYQLPAWCLETAEKYVESKAKEGWEKSTLCMIRSSITRFCTYMDIQGIRSFREIRASHIKDFNAADRHKSPQGKNAYNARIRKFLIYLGEHQCLENPMLFIALPCTSAPKETIVVVLTAEEMDELRDQIDTEDSRLSLRKKAMLLLGLKMGLRSSDVVNLSIDDINWGTASVRFLQKKTSVEVSLPMPAEVGNALFRYITEERGKRSSSKIFLTEKAPHRPVGRGVCINALKTALPDRNVEGSGFHVMRKTYATNLLKNGVGAGMVAEALGQRGTASVSRYLSLDTDRMRMCPLSLLECGIGGWKHE
jgi:site-specific recombinase XerD